jgi:hypothetical protein
MSPDEIYSVEQDSQHAEKAPPPFVILSEAKNPSSILRQEREILRFAQNDKIKNFV